MSLFTANRPQKNFIAAAVQESMARQRPETAVKAAPSPSPQPSTNAKRKHDQNNLIVDTIDLTEEDDNTTSQAIQHPSRPQKKQRIISPQSPQEERQPRTPQKQHPRSSFETPQSLAKMPSLLQNALKTAAPRKSVQSPQSPTEDTAALKRKRESSPDFAQGFSSRNESLQSSVEEGPAHPASANNYSPHSPIEEGPTHSAPEGRDSPQSPVEETFIRPCSAAKYSPHSPVEEPLTSLPSAPPGLGSPRSPVQEVPPHENVEEADNNALPTPTSTPTKAKDLESSEVSDRYTTQTIDGVEYRNPAKFCLKPPYWRKWDARTYVLFAEHLRYHFDPMPFAAETGLPAEEITHVFNSVVCNPLYFAKEASKRGEEGMQEVMDLYRNPKYATPKRPWGREGGGEKRVRGEVKGVRKGEVELVLAASGDKKVLGLEELGEKDVKYLRENLREEDKKVLWG